MQFEGGAVVRSEMSATCVAIVSPAAMPPNGPIATYLRRCKTVAVTKKRPALGIRFRSDRVVHFHAGAVAQRTQHFVTAGDNFVAGLQSVFHFNFRGASESGLDDLEFGFLVTDDEDALELFFFLLGRGGR